MFKKFLCTIAAAVFFAACPLRVYAAEVNAKAAVLIEAASGRIIAEKNANERLPMASTTKIMTALLTLEQDNLDEYFVVDEGAICVEGSSMGLTAGDSVTLRVLAAGMLLASGNDAANAAAVRVAGSVPAFVKLMNDRAAELGMVNTAFVTPSGLSAEGHYSTAYDMALLAREALQNKNFAKICRQKSMTLCFGNPPFKRVLFNHNSLLKSYKGASGVKTGFTKEAGRCLVSSAWRDGVRLICVTLACPDDWHEHTRLLDYGFATLKATSLSEFMPPLSLSVGGGVKPTVKLAPQRAAVAALAEGDKTRIETRVLLGRAVAAPVQKGQVLGEVIFTLDKNELLRVPLYASEAVAARELTKTPNYFGFSIKRLFTGKDG
ncbi:MAG: D-alanyl-D-alanine carboxypeptidase family protein [Hydrogenoanaerobacterium sp.]